MFTEIMYQGKSKAVSFRQPIRVRLGPMVLIAGSRGKQFLVQRIFSVCSAALFIVVSTTLPAQGPPPGMEQVLPRVQDHVDEFAHRLPDFISNETITSSEVMGNGRTGRKVVIESEFKGRQNNVENGRPFIESREIKTINGSTVKPDHQLTGPFFYLGGFSSILVAVFSRENEPYFNYTFAGTEKLAGRPALIFKFETRHGQKKLLYHDILNRHAYVKGKGKAWIDPETMNVLRLEFHYLDSADAIGGLDVTVDYSPVTIQDKTFWMPQRVTAVQAIPGSRSMSVRYTAAYSNYHRFSVSIRFD